MPRRKRTFIQRPKAQTYQLVHQPTADDPDRHILVPGDSSKVENHLENNGASSAEVTKSATEACDLEPSYDKKDYELGEFGFPDDGYDYSKHFRTIGGGGGVFIDAESGMPDPDAVRGKPSVQPLDDKRIDAVVLREDVEEPKEELDTAWRNPDDVAMQQEAVEQIKRDRKHDPDLQEIFNALDSDGELCSTASASDGDLALGQPGGETVSFDDDVESDSHSGLEDDFVVMAAKEDDAEDTDASNDKPIGPDRPPSLDGIVEEYREPRLLDAQFDNFMKDYNFESSSDDEDVENFKQYAREQAEKETSEKDVLALLSENEKQAFGMGEGEAEVLNRLSNLNWEDGNATNEEELEGDGETSVSNNDKVETERQEEFETFASAEFERGMKGVLDLYTRVPGTDALLTGEGLDGARQAIARQETEEKNHVNEKNELGLESDGHDSDLDTLFDEMYKDDIEKWDCKTIISTYTNTDNHPSVIDAPASSKRRSVQNRPIICLDPRTQAPAEFMPKAEDAASSRREVDFGTRRIVRVERTLRQKGESKEEKKARKTAVKEAARERRALKSDMKKAFKAEDAKQNAHAVSLGNTKVSVQF